MLFSIFISTYFKASVPRSLILTIVSAGFLSICVEVLQFKFGFGTFETEDIVCNVFGGIVGASLFMVIARCIR